MEIKEKKKISLKSKDKINLKDIYTESEINILKEAFPNIIPLITYDFNKKNSQFIDKNDFLEIILKSLKLSLNEKNNDELSKMCFTDSNVSNIDNLTSRNMALSNSGNNTYRNKSKKIDKNSQKKNNVLHRNNLNNDLIKRKTEKLMLFNKNHHISNLSYEFLPFSYNNSKKNINKSKHNNNNNHSINLVPNLMDNLYENNNKIKTFKTNAVVNNFITLDKLNNSKPKNKNLIKELLLLNLDDKQKKFKFNKDLIQQINPSSHHSPNRVKIDLNPSSGSRIMNSPSNNNNSSRTKKIIKKNNEVNFQESHKLFLPKEKIPKTIKTININLISNEDIESNTFNIFQFDKDVGRENTLLSISTYIYNKFFFSLLINSDKFNNWCQKIAGGYSKTIPYHTSLHAADVAQTSFTYFIYGKINNICKFNNISICSLFLSCLCHDFKHPGLNNNFMKEIKHELATRYNDISILENMHIAETFKIINENKDCDIFTDIDSYTYKQIRKEMISCVLSTDMFYHSKHNEFMNKIIEKQKTGNFNENINNTNEDNQNYLNLIIHSADISNPTKPFNIYINWGKLVYEELSSIGDKEKEYGIKCSFDREKLTLEKSQISFIDYIVQPFYSNFLTIFPKLQYLNDNVIKNRKILENKNEKK